MFINVGAREMLLKGERTKFLQEQWPAIAATIKRLGLTPEELVANAGGSNGVGGGRGAAGAGGNGRDGGADAPKKNSNTNEDR
jgi:hypothetical protein